MWDRFGQHLLTCICNMYLSKLTSIAIRMACWDDIVSNGRLLRFCDEAFGIIWPPQLGGKKHHNIPHSSQFMKIVGPLGMQQAGVFSATFGRANSGGSSACLDAQVNQPKSLQRCPLCHKTAGSSRARRSTQCESVWHCDAHNIPWHTVTYGDPSC